MKKLQLIKYILVLLCLSPVALMAQDDKEEAPEPVIKLKYLCSNNSMQYLILESSLKKDKVFTPQANKTYELYLDSVGTNNLISKVTTDKNGKAKAFIPPTLQGKWAAADQHTFVVMQGDEEIISDYIIHKSKVSIDTATADGVRTLTVTFQKFENKAWVPAADVEMRVGISRMGGIMSAGDDETYTTDSAGTITVELTKLNLPGDAKGNLVMAAKIEDNDEYGNVLFETTVPWGTKHVASTDFFKQRKLWTTRFHTPYWLLFMAYTISLIVWSTVIYLFFQLFKIWKLGKASTH